MLEELPSPNSELPQPETVSPPANNSPPKKIIAVLILVIVIAVLVISGAVYLWLRSQDRAQPSTIPFSTGLPAASDLTIATSSPNPLASSLVEHITTTPSPNAAATHSVAQLNSPSLSAGTYMIQAFVVRKITCPPCSAGALCEPCPDDGILISETKKEDPDYYIATENELFARTDNPEQFVLGKQYLFTLQKQIDPSDSGKSDFILISATPQ